MTDLQQQCEYLAENLLGWEEELVKYLLTGNGMLEIIEAMRKLGWDILSISGLYCAFGRTDPHKVVGSCGGCESIPEAVIRAAYSAMKGNE